MTNIRVDLRFDKMDTFLTERSFADQIYQTQIEKEFKEKDAFQNSEVVIDIYYPDHVKNISISFNKQLNTRIVSYFPKEMPLKVNYHSENSYLQSKIREDIDF